jgi:polyisoprenyl-phosphate glycosyltransferase
MLDKILSIVVPVFRNKETLSETFSSLKLIHREFLSHYKLEVVFVDDGSDDGSWEVLKQLHDNYLDEISLVKLSRNFGQVCAIFAGYECARGDAVVTLSADLQDPARLIVDMVMNWQDGFEVAIAYRTARNDDISSKLFSRLAYGFARMANPKIPTGGFDYLLLSRRAVNILNNFRGRHRFFQGDILWLGLPTTFIPYERLKRPAGRSGWSFSKKIKYFTDLMLDSSYLPIRLMSMLGIGTAFGGILFASVIVWSWFSNQTPFPGWAALMVTQLVIGGLIMTMLGIVGEYLWRIYDDIKIRPLYVVERQEIARMTVKTNTGVEFEEK